MCSLTLEAATLGILAACEVIARSLWPELFEDRPASSPEITGEDQDHHDEMAIW